MKVLTEGHCYELASLHGSDSQTIQFIHKEILCDSNPNEALDTVRDGTTNEEVLKVLIDRIQYLNKKIPCRENSIVITKLEEALMWLEKRTENRKAREAEGTNKP